MNNKIYTAKKIKTKPETTQGQMAAVQAKRGKKAQNGLFAEKGSKRPLLGPFWQKGRFWPFWAELRLGFT